MQEVSLYDINIIAIYFFHRRKKTKGRRLEIHLEENVINPELFFLFFFSQDLKFLHKSWLFYHIYREELSLHESS